MKAFRWFSPVLFLALACLFLPASSWAKQPKYLLKMATLAPKGIGWAQAWIKILEPALAEATNGELGFKTFYGGVMGDDEDYIKKMRIDQLQAASITGQGALEICPEMSVLELPFLMRNYDEVDYVRERMYPVFDKIFLDRGFALIYWFEQDFDQVYSTRYPMNKPQDFAQARFLTWYGPVEEKCLEALGVQPIPINGPEVPAALRQKVIDSLIAPSVWVVGTQTYTTIKYVNPMKIRYAPGLNVWTKKAFMELPPEYRKRVLETRKGPLVEFITFTRDANAKALEALVQYGMKESTPSPKDLEEMKRKTRVVYDELAGVHYPQAMLDQILGYLEEYRAAH